MPTINPQISRRVTGQFPTIGPTPKRGRKTIQEFTANLAEMERLVTNPQTDLFARIPHGEGQTILREALLLADHIHAQWRIVIHDLLCGKLRINLNAKDGRDCLADELLKWRSEFPILDKTVYLISHSLGAMPRAAYDRLHDYAEAWATRGVRAWAEGWWEMPVTVGNEVARIIGADSDTVVMHQNVSICQSLILSCFEPQPERNKIVYSELNFPSVMYVYEAHARNGSLRIEAVKSDDGMTVPLERMLAAIDEHTLLVPFSHVLFKSAFLQDARAITERAHEVGAMVVLDVYQSAGTVPFNVKELNVDFATGGSVKWLCGGPGAGYLYVRPDLQLRLEPKTTGWMAHEEPFAFETELRYAPRITRFLHGSPAIPALYAAQAGYEVINQIGVERIREKSVRQTARLIELAQAAGFDVTSPADPSQRGGTVTVSHEYAAAITKELIRREFIVDYRPGAGVRISPHFYTTDEELELVISEMETIRNTRAYARHEAAGATF